MCEGIKDSKNQCPRIQKDLKLVFDGAEMGDEAKKIGKTGKKAPCSFNNSLQSSYYVSGITLSARDRIVSKIDNAIVAIVRVVKFILQKTQKAEQRHENGVLGTKCK